LTPDLCGNRRWMQSLFHHIRCLGERCIPSLCGEVENKYFICKKDISSDIFAFVMFPSLPLLN
jgi:hypothetical protein